jgi:hypothetical protein
VTDGSSDISPEFDAEHPLVQRGDIIALLGTTLRVLNECRFPNGAVVVAPAFLPSYPRDAPNGLLCEPGLTLALAIAALDELDRDERSALLDWVANCADRFQEVGILRARYAVNGSILTDVPDRLGSGLLLAAIARRPLSDGAPLRAAVVRPLAAGLAVGDDLRTTAPAAEPADALLDAARWASTLAGLRAAQHLLGADEWGRAADRAFDALQEAIGLVFADDGAASLVDEIADQEPSRFVHVADYVLPEHLAAVLTLAWPLALPDNPAAVQCLHLAERLNGPPELSLANETGNETPSLAERFDWPEPGVYPFAVFWLAAAQAAHGRAAQAEQTFSYGVSLANADGHFPEFVGGDLARSAACPDLKTHLAFVLAAGALGHLKRLPRSGYTAARRPRSAA